MRATLWYLYQCTKAQCLAEAAHLSWLIPTISASQDPRQSLECVGKDPKACRCRTITPDAALQLRAEIKGARLGF